MSFSLTLSSAAYTVLLTRYRCSQLWYFVLHHKTFYFWGFVLQHQLFSKRHNYLVGIFDSYRTLHSNPKSFRFCKYQNFCKKMYVTLVHCKLNTSRIVEAVRSGTVIAPSSSDLQQPAPNHPSTLRLAQDRQAEDDFSLSTQCTSSRCLTY